MTRTSPLLWLGAVALLAACSGDPSTGPGTDTGSDDTESPDTELDAVVPDTDTADDTDLDTVDADDADTADDIDTADTAPDVQDDTVADVEDDTDTGAEDTTPDVEEDTAEDVTDDTDIDAEDTTTDAEEDTAEDIEEDTVDLCEGGILCGEGDCCRAPNECAEGVCIAACDSGIRCDGACCDEGDYCVSGGCTPSLGACIDSFDCPVGYFCEPTLGACLAQPDDITCEYIPTFSDMNFAVEWAYVDDMSISIPVVGDLDDDKFPDVVVNLTQQVGTDWQAGRVVVLDGRDGSLKLDLNPIDHPDVPYSQGRSTLAIGDVDGDSFPDIIYAAAPSGGSQIVAVDHLGNLLWRAHTADGTPISMNVVNGAISVANFDDDPMAEIVVGASLIDHDGLVIWNEGGDGSVYGTNNTYTGGISAIADLTGDGTPDIVSGQHAWQVSWPAGDRDAATVTPLWDVGAPDGYPAIADMTLDGNPDVVLVGNGSVRLINGVTGDVLSTIAVPMPAGGTLSRNRGGPPTIADFDGDGRPEVGIAGGYSYTVYDLNREGESVVTGGAMPAPGELFVTWTHVTQDLSSNATGSSVFDFQGDGRAEVVYADEQFIRVYDGADGTILLEQANNSSTIHEYPLVVDVDADGNSEIIAVANGPGAQRGVYVYGDPSDNWVGTRPVWTQHSYHVTNATSVGNPPMTEDNNWTEDGLNNYRQNVQREGIFNAPDLRVELSFDPSACWEGNLILVARVWNEGSLGVRAGVPVAFYQGDVGGTLLGTALTTEDILPGASTSVRLTVPLPELIGERTYAVQVDPDGGTSECLEDNNTDGAWIDLCLGY